MKNYGIMFQVVGYIYIEVEANNAKEAEEIAALKFNEADCGELENIEGIVWDTYEDGKRVDE